MASLGTTVSEGKAMRMHMEQVERKARIAARAALLAARQRPYQPPPPVEPTEAA